LRNCLLRYVARRIGNIELLTLSDGFDTDPGAL
jgi:hypothetical protein